LEQKRVLILGAARYYSACIEAAREAGFFVVGIDRNEKAYAAHLCDVFEPVDIVDKAAVLELAKRYQVHGVIPINDYGVPTASYVSQQMGLNGIDSQVAEVSTNKELMREAWIEKGISCPKVAVATERKEFLEAIKFVGFPCIFKPAHGIGGASRGVVVVKSMEEMDDAITFTQSFYSDKATLVESFIEADIEHSAEVLVYQGEAYVAAIGDKVKTPLPYRVDKNVIYPTALDAMAESDLSEAIKEAVLALGIDNGMAHIEVASTKTGPVFFELGARCGGGGTANPIVKFATGIDIFVEFVRISCGIPPISTKPKKRLACNYHFITPTPGKVIAVNGLDAMVHPDVLDFELFTKPGDEIKEVKVGTDRSGFIIVGGQNRVTVLERGYELERQLNFRYE